MPTPDPAVACKTIERMLVAIAAALMDSTADVDVVTTVVGNQLHAILSGPPATVGALIGKHGQTKQAINVLVDRGAKRFKLNGGGSVQIQDRAP